MSLGLKGLNFFYYSLIITCVFCANHKVGEVFEFSREDFELFPREFETLSKCGTWYKLRALVGGYPHE